MGDLKGLVLKIATSSLRTTVQKKYLGQILPKGSGLISHLWQTGDICHRQEHPIRVTISYRQKSVR